MLTAIEALERILEQARTLPPVEMSLREAGGCVLATDVMSQIDLPPFNNSAMDGFAICVGELLCHQIDISQVSQTVKAGDNPQPLANGACAKIMTGAMLPEGANAVVPVEDLTLKGPFKQGQHIRFKGEDVKKGDVIAKKGDILTNRLALLLASSGVSQISVYPKPKVTIIVTGNELATCGTPLEAGKIYESNSVGLGLALKELNITAKALTAKDDLAGISSLIQSSFDDCDLLLTVGGVSVGDYDHVKTALKDVGVELDFWKVAIKPGKPLVFGTFKNKLIFGLPGNPVSCMVTFDRFVRPTILKMSGHKIFEKEKRKAIAEERFEGTKGRTTLLAGNYYSVDGKLFVKTSGRQGSAMLKSFAMANCLVNVPEDREIIEKGEMVTIELL